MKIDFKKYLIILGIEFLTIIVLNLILNKIMFDTRLEAGSWGLFAPLIIFKESFANSSYLGNSFFILNFIIDLLLLFLTPLIVLLLIKKNK